MQRAVVPQLDFRCSRWPPQKQIADELDTLQRNMTAVLIRTPRLEAEETNDYFRRRRRIARNLCIENGLWSKRWFSRSLKWDQHLARPLNRHSWPAQLREYRGREWLMERRMSFAPSVASRTSSASILAGRTDTRAVRGKVHMRWHDGIEFAKDNARS